MAAADLQMALMRPAVLQILRATGFNHARPAVIDTVTDLTVKYISLLASNTARNSLSNHGSLVPTIQDVRLALTEVGALLPQMGITEELARGDVMVNGELMPFEDLRGVEGFIKWAQGPANREIRRIAGFGDEANVEEIAAGLDDLEDYVTALKKKHSKTGEESRYQGTVLGKDSELQPVLIAGGEVGKISDWRASTRDNIAASEEDKEIEDDGSPLSSGFSSAPSTPVDVMDVLASNQG